ncbi:MAG: TM2 domain-containing protein [Lachnoclostridium sp.]|nr:TM2 domain-containing protein [Lachnoclostridium sp.]
MYKKCPKCGGFVSDRDLECPMCHADLREFNSQEPSQQPPFTQQQPPFTQQQQSYGQQQPPYGQPGYNNYINGSPSYLANDLFASDPFGKSRGVAALLAIFLGSLGVHYFYLGKMTPGIVFLLCTLCTCGTLGLITSIIALIQGILMLCMTNQEFTRKYVSTPSSFPIF